MSSSEIKYTDLKATDLIIGFIGLTGSGKSNIVDHLAGLDHEHKRASKSTDLNLCTQKIAAIRIHNQPPYGDRLVLVDTPGFDQDQGSDIKILDMVKGWLHIAEQGQIRLAGIIYVHRITDNRMARSLASNIRQFKELCGDNYLKKVLLVTTMWVKPSTTNLEERETQITEKYWNTMIEKGAGVARFLNTPESAWELVKSVVGDGSRAETLAPAQETPLPESEFLAQKTDADIAPFQYLSGDILVALMGPTGSGKSTIVDQLTGHSQKRAGSKLKSCTEDVAAIRVQDHPTYGNRLVLVDTPGFDDTERSDEQILEIIGNWLKDTYEQNISLSGILYLHRISDNRMSGTPQRNLRTFGKLCGDNAAKKVLLVTTMWDKVPIDTAESRDLELKTRFWDAMLEKGSDIGRFHNDRTSASKLVEMVLKESTTEMLLLQEELVLLKRKLNETSAGKEVCTSLQHLLSKQKRIVSSLSESAGVNQDPQDAAQLNDRLLNHQRDLEQIIQQVENLKIPFLRKITIFFSRRPKARAVEFGFHA